MGTDSNARLSRVTIHEKVHKIIPDHPESRISTLVDGALKRLAKHTIKHWQREDEFCLAHEEVQRLNNFRVDAALAETNLNQAIVRIAVAQTSALSLDESAATSFQTALRMALDVIIFERSQAFAMAVQSGTLAELADTDFRSTVLSVLANSSLPKLPRVDWSTLLRHAVRNALISDESAIHSYLRSLSDAYTLLAFLKQTPDVQGAVEKMFSHGMLWLDATVVLPLLADTLAELDEDRGRFSRMIDAAKDAGLQLFVTSGVIEEVERHMNRALMCARMTYAQWEGSVPYILERYISSGRSTASFPTWLDNFRGESRPLQDIAEYLTEQFSVRERSLESERDASSPELRYALQQIWHERYERRKEKYGTPLDDMAVTKLVNHDIECYAGIVQLRKEEHASPFGYSAWWLTVDRQTFDLKNRLRPLMGKQPPDSPVMSADFLLNYLAFGPVRRRVTKAKESDLPLLMVLGSATPLTRDLISEAESIRTNIKDLPERVIRRQVRDHLDRARSRIGAIANMGMDEVDDALQRDLAVEA